MYYPVVSECIHTLKLVETWLDKAEQLAAAKEFDVNVLMASRLAPDMKDFVYQIQRACDYVKGAAAWPLGFSYVAGRKEVPFAKCLPRGGELDDALMNRTIIIIGYIDSILVINCHSKRAVERQALWACSWLVGECTRR